MGNKPALLTITIWGFVWISVLTRRLTACIIYVTTHTPPLFADTISHPKDIWCTVITMCFTKFIISFLSAYTLTDTDCARSTKPQ